MGKWFVAKRREMHRCGNGFKGQVVHGRKLTFCGFCGAEKKIRVKKNANTRRNIPRRR